MEIPNKVLKYGCIVLIVVVVGLVLVGAVKKSAYDSRIIELQNTVASRDQTIETQKGVYQKLSIQSRDLRDLLDKRDEQIKALEKQLKKSGDELLTANTLIVKLKKDLESNGSATQPTPDPQAPGIVRVDFDSKDDFLPFKVAGHTLGDCERKQPPSANLKLSQVRPLKLSVVVSQGSDGSWKTSTTSSEENFGVDIALAAVNPYILEPRWYEKIGIDFELGVGTGPGFLVGTGVSYVFGKFEVGPKAWVVIDGAGVNPYFGAQLVWHPFQR